MKQKGHRCIAVTGGRNLALLSIYLFCVNVKHNAILKKVSCFPCIHVTYKLPLLYES